MLALAVERGGTAQLLTVLASQHPDHTILGGQALGSVRGESMVQASAHAGSRCPVKERGPEIVEGVDTITLRPSRNR